MFNGWWTGDSNKNIIPRNRPGRLPLNKKTKRRVLILLTLLSVWTVLLSLGLSRLTFQPGIPFSETGQINESSAHEDVNPVHNSSAKNFLKIILILSFLAAIVILVIYIIKTGKRWKDAYTGIKYALIVIIMIAGLTMFMLFLLPNGREGDTSEIHTAGGIKPPEDGLPGKVPDIILWATGIMLVGLAGVLVFRIVSSRREKSRLDHMIELEAADARKAIESGENLKNVILNYYRKMCSVLSEEQNIERKANMTVVEFENTLKAAGVPQKPVRELTGLFEAARYGNWEPRAHDEKNAVRCFDEIILYFRSEERNRADDEK